MFEAQSEISQGERLDLKTRNKIQIELMKLMLPEITDEKELEWAEIYSKKVSDIIDHSDNDVIRQLALEGKITESAILLKWKLLHENISN